MNLRANNRQQGGRIKAVWNSASPLRRRLHEIVRWWNLLSAASRRRRRAGTLFGGTLLRLPRHLGASAAAALVEDEGDFITIRGVCIFN